MIALRTFTSSSWNEYFTAWLLKQVQYLKNRVVCKKYVLYSIKINEDMYVHIRLPIGSETFSLENRILKLNLTKKLFSLIVETKIYCKFWMQILFYYRKQLSYNIYLLLNFKIIIHFLNWFCLFNANSERPWDP